MSQRNQINNQEKKNLKSNLMQPWLPFDQTRRVLQRLPTLVEQGENERAKRLLLGLHERLWHSPASDFTNLLRRAGMSGEVISLAKEAVKCCAICRKYIRLPNRPQLRARGAHVFNETVQMDLFYWESTWFMLLIDEATRFKKCGTIDGQESEHLMKAILELWIYHFGPPERLVLDQQVALMSHDSGAEFERLGINRCPRGTTSGHGSEQHTGTGIVERHVQLTKLTMFKLRAELQRQGLQPTEPELGQEAAMAQNLTLSYGGVTPSMAVYGTMPREFYNPDSEHVMNTEGALETDLTVFERALRIRQTSLAQAQQAVIEDRVARASRTRPHTNWMLANLWPELQKLNFTGRSRMTKDGEDRRFYYALMLTKELPSYSIKESPTWSLCDTSELSVASTTWRFKPLRWTMHFGSS